MLIDGWFQYRTFVRVFNAHRAPPHLGYNAAVAYLGPLVLCGVSFAIWEDDYGFAVSASADNVPSNGTSPALQDVCFINQESDVRLMFFVPLVLVLLLNVFFFGAVMYVVVSAPVGRTARKKLVPPRTARALKASLMFLPTMGFSWGFGIVAVELSDDDARLVFTWLFTLLMVAQGVIIFWFHLYQDREARQKLSLGLFFGASWNSRSKKKRNQAVQRGRHDQQWFKQTPSGPTPDGAAGSSDGAHAGVTGSSRSSGAPPPAYKRAPMCS